MAKSPLERFWEKVDKSGECWVWKGHLIRGYGRFWFERDSHQAHRWWWERVNGPVPKGLHLDHLCRNRACVNPERLTRAYIEACRLGSRAPAGTLIQAGADLVSVFDRHGGEHAVLLALIASARAARRVEAVLAELADDEGLTRREAAILAALTATAEPTDGEER